MQYKYTTPVQNTLFDVHLPILTGSELKVLMVVVRQTNGWIDKRTGFRKKRDRISISQFITKTGMSKRVVSISIDSLVAKGLITCTDTNHTSLNSTSLRKGKSMIYYSPLLHDTHLMSEAKGDKYTGKESFGNISEQVERMKSLW